jgi:tyrosyl-tRNA synthetase
MNCADEDVDRYMKILTLVETEEIDNIVKNHFIAPEKRE